MTTLQNTIVILWLVPVVGLIVIPLLWSLFQKLYAGLKQSRLADIRGYVTADAPGGSEKRHIDRLHLEVGKAYVDEKSDCCEASVSDISKDGICLKNVSCNINPGSEQLRVLFRTRQKGYALMAKPKWKKLTENGYEIGAVIENTPSEWNKLVEGAFRSVSAAPA